jgi:hypothetical protein
MTVAYFGMPGPLEILVGLACLGVLAAAAVLVVVLIVRGGRGSTGGGNPNLVPCPDCGQWISRMARACPRCGRPVNSE